MSQSSSISALQMWVRAPKTAIRQLPLPPTMIAGELGRTQAAAICHTCHSLRWTRKQDLAPDSWGANERNEFSEPRSLHLRIHRTLNFLTWCLIFDIQTACSLCCKPVYSLTATRNSSEQFSQSYWDTVSQAQSLKYSHQIK